MAKGLFYYSPAVAHLEVGDHVLRPTRLQYTYELLQAYGAFAGEESRAVEPAPAPEESLLAWHTPEYVAAVRRLSAGDTQVDAAAYNFSQAGDNPVVPGMYPAALLAVGGSLAAARQVAEGHVRVAFNPAGGQHHAMPDHASGFCIFNDPALAIFSLLERSQRVAYVDIDAHHADGVQRAFYKTDQVLTISLHQSGRTLFPGTGEVEEWGAGPGRGYAVNVPLAPFTDDETYLWAFQEVVPPLLQHFQPDVVVSQLGADGHYRDPLTQLMLTTAGYTRVVESLAELAPRWVALGGGGYEVSAVLRLWSLAYGIMIGRSWPDEIPTPFAQRYGIRRLRDGDPAPLNEAQRRQVRRFAEASVSRVHKLIFPRHGLAG